MAEGNLTMAKKLVEQGCDITMGFFWGITLLDFAAGKGASSSSTREGDLQIQNLHAKKQNLHAWRSRKENLHAWRFVEISHSTFKRIHPRTTGYSFVH